MMTRRQTFEIIFIWLLAFALSVMFGGMRPAGAAPNPGTMNGGIIRTGTVPVSALAAGSTTPSSATYYRGDGTWQSITASYTLPIASATVLGGVKIGAGIVEQSDGTISVTAASSGGFTPGSATAPSTIGLYIASYSGTSMYAYASAFWGTGTSVYAEGGGELRWQYSTDGGSTYVGIDGTSATYFLTKGSQFWVPHPITSGALYVRCLDVNAAGSVTSAVSTSIAYAAPPTTVYTGTAPISVSGSTISVANATTSAPGVVQVGSGLSIVGGVLSANTQTATGAAGGDLTGTYPNPTLAAVGTAGTYTFGHSATYDSKGREIAASNPTGTASSSTFLRGDGTWATPAGGAAYTFTAPLVNSGGTVSASVFGASGSSHASGIVPDPGSTAGTTRFLREDGTFAIPSATPILSLNFGNTFVAQGYQVSPSYPTLIAAPLLTSQGSSNTTYGYKGGTATVISKPTDTANLTHGYLFTEGTGTTLNDEITSSPDNATITTGTGSGWVSDATGGTGYLFKPNGTTTTVKAVPASNLLTGTGSFTLEFYVNFAFVQASTLFYAASSISAGYAIQMYCNSGTPFAINVVNSSNSAVAATDTVNATTGYYDLVATYNASTGALILYKNGVSVATNTLSGTLAPYTANGEIIGSNPAGNTGWSGDIFVARFYSGYVMPASEVASRYANLGQVGLTSVVNLGTYTNCPVAALTINIGYAGNLTRVAEWSNDGVTWTAITMSGTPPAHGGTYSSYTDSVTGLSLTPAYVRYSAKDSSTNLRLTYLGVN